MSDVTISIEIRIEASSESKAREYAAVHDIDTTRAHWHQNPGAKEGRLYVAGSTPLRATQSSKNAAEAETLVEDKRG